MKSFSLVVVVWILRVTCQSPCNFWTLYPNTLVLDVDGSVLHHSLTCLENSNNSNQEILWRKNGIDDVTQRGNTYTIRLEESRGGGNYTCHRVDGSILNHTVVLIQVYKKLRIIVKEDHEDYVQCSTQNYSGGFRCSWTWHKKRVGEVTSIEVSRVSDTGDTRCSVVIHNKHWKCSSGQNTFDCWVDGTGNAISCQDKHYCPFAEEIQYIRLTIYVRSQLFLLENYSKQFLLSEIVKPDKVKIEKVNTSLIKCGYPTSWSHPHSYFPLTFQFVALKKRGRDCEDLYTNSNISEPKKYETLGSCQFPIKSRVKSVCVRAKDAFCNSQWSEWKHIKVKRRKKNNKSNQILMD